MRLVKFSIRGLRSLKNLSWKPGNLNVLIGPNGSGKSNLMRSLELIRQAGTSDLDSAIIREGGIGALLWDGRAGEVGWEMEIEPGFTPPVNRPDERLRYDLILSPMGYGRGYRIDRELLCNVSPGNHAQDFKYFERDQRTATSLDVPVARERLEETQTILAQTAKTFSKPDVFFLFTYLKAWGIYHDLAVQQNSLVRRAAITRTESRLAPDGENLVAVLHTLYTTDREFKSQVNDAMRAAFGKEFEGLEFTPAEDQRVQMRVQWKSLKSLQSAADLSDGTLRFLMLVAILANSARGDLVAIDEPETHLHPSMFPIIAELAVEASRSSQIVFTTHSPEFLTAIGPSKPTTGVLQCIAGETKLSILDGQDLQRWLEKYKLGELFVSGELEALA
jgi:predicted ATPase